MAVPTLDTELAAINAMLHDVGERPVNTLEDQARLDVVRAIDSLRRASRMTQETGWWFNTEEITITLDTNYQYPIDTDIARLEWVEGGPAAPADGNEPELVQRGGFVYDRANARNVFASTDEDLVVSVVRLLDFEDLPPTVREYVYCVASIRFQSRTLGSTAVDADLREQANIALISMREEQVDWENCDQTFSPHFINLMYNR